MSDTFIPAVTGDADADDRAITVRRMLTAYYDASYPPSLFPGAGASDPHISSLAPATAVDGAPTAISVTGLHFDPDAQVEVDGIALATTFVSATHLTTNYTPAIGGGATVLFSVRNVGTGMESNDSPFVVTASAVRATRSTRRTTVDPDPPPPDPETPAPE